MTNNEVENWQTFQARISDLPQESAWLIDYAYQLAKSGHRTQSRIGGDRYFEHPRTVAIIILDEFKIKDPDLIIGGLLHDVGEDTSVFGNPSKHPYFKWKEQANFLLVKSFNPRVAEIVLAVTKPYIDNQDIFSKEVVEELAIDNLLKGSSAAKVVKMADRIHNLRSMDAIPDQTRRQRKLQETVDHYFPVFNRALEDYPTVVPYALNQMLLAPSHWKNER